MDRNIYMDMMEQAVPDAALIQKTKRKMSARITRPEKYPSRKDATEMTARTKRPLKTMLIAAVLTTLFVISAFAAGNVIYRFIAGESNEAKNQIMSMSVGNNIVLTIGSAEVTMDEYYAPHMNLPADGDMWKHFSTVEEANIFSRFSINAPSYTDTSLLQASVIIDGNGLPGYTVLLSYDGYTSLCMDYIGDDAYIDVREANGSAMQRILVGNTEGVAVSRAEDLWTLIWMKEGILYRLERYYHHGDERFERDLEVLLTIAEST